MEELLRLTESVVGDDDALALDEFERRSRSDDSECGLVDGAGADASMNTDTGANAYCLWCGFELGFECRCGLGSELALECRCWSEPELECRCGLGSEFGFEPEPVTAPAPAPPPSSPPPASHVPVTTRSRRTAAMLAVTTPVAAPMVVTAPVPPVPLHVQPQRKKYMMTPEQHAKRLEYYRKWRMAHPNYGREWRMAHPNYEHEKYMARAGKRRAADGPLAETLAGPRARAAATAFAVP